MRLKALILLTCGEMWCFCGEYYALVFTQHVLVRI